MLKPPLYTACEISAQKLAGDILFYLWQLQSIQPRLKAKFYGYFINLGMRSGNFIMEKLTQPVLKE